jgi:hypothetical protein
VYGKQNYKLKVKIKVVTLHSVKAYGGVEV